MRQAIAKRDSIYAQLLLLLAFSAVMALGFFLASEKIEDVLIETYYFDGQYFHKKNEVYIDRLKEYIEEKQITSKDTQELSEWVKKQKLLVSITVSKDGMVMYDSDYPTREIWRENIKADSYDAEYFLVDFLDGEMEVIVWIRDIYRVYLYTDIIRLILAFLQFLAIFLYGVYAKMRYISQLRDEIDILKGGGLDYHITVKGNDEIAALARGIENMRSSFCESTEREAQMVKENQKIVTQMSHDIRTPITSIMLYTEILKKGRYQDKKQQREYIHKIDEKARRMKQLAENLFEYSLVNTDSGISLEEPEDYDVLFYDMFSETCNYLEQYGFEVKLLRQKIDGKIRISTEYLTRIMDNITSNILKYADENYPVWIKVLNDDFEAGFAIQNSVAHHTKNNAESTCVGIESIKTMMRKMNGHCNVSEKDDIYAIEILFPLEEEM